MWFCPALSLRGAKRRGPQGSAASGLRATAASGGGKGAKKLGSHLVLRKQRAAQNLSGNPEESSDRSGWAGACVCVNNVRRKCLATTRKSASQTLQVSKCFRTIDRYRRDGLPRQCAHWLAMTAFFEHLHYICSCLFKPIIIIPVYRFTEPACF